MTEPITVPTPQQIIEPAVAGRTETMVLNMGPHHPSTHGVLRLVLELDGEVVVNVAPDVGYLHTGIEKTMESKTYQKAVVLTDRMDYLAPLSNNLCYALAVEKLLDVEIPERAQIARVLLTELQRISSHLVWLGTHALDLAAMSVFLYAFREREQILDIFELVSGARMMTSYFRIGGLAYDLPSDFIPTVEQFLAVMPSRIDEYEDLLTANPLWLERTVGVGVIDAQSAIALGLTGANLRATGVAYDVRKAMPYSGYETYSFEIPVGKNGDIYDRYRVRIAEMRQSVKIVQQATERLRELGPGPVVTSNRKVAPPPKREITESMESLIHHFKLWTEGFKPPRGDAYVSIESPRGILGCYVVSDGSPKPWRVHFRAPSFINLQSLAHMAKGRMVADLVALIASLDPVLGEVDR
ncbi:MAG TPA: NADH-quinone oxidoreductase subunit D 2 [Chloroflexus aurantiacus]|jgi:NADH-quinone oxidoreductase subunit D|uniref:NADH-quinone oxidoreductase subunit D 2 n=1 Tax=Chloroflexus aurantiacus (strain ATCC 29366 / DSM 635 / J-10-fl) TaxID=324602 RepID=NUOD2_CHLAA|nr:MULTISPECIES: NADH dehydrogenase (quinone) subunit D [Chloroflexus]A9WFB4.1 RecName: Full=NADH-quinone oxidoreductase subunit D 2; AltName: Full=NADH dehydrogenase I subunit D 2; AltName: Full=NDH-1 subunit D 2 [Chloroflexus aurantiacus J-10-fl]RMG51066.1 MAG: NADH-quinone oxidoreductase subunit D 2 [Chloroflexota bacterium]ABY36098.1 NADH dehydrogenase I, D subunit [Chloroflexus aurantiacus J-10-fl]GIV91362.1 MAG: NADH-quinone oxidoreductase subunit D 2 [Chloroflexus sp.]HBW66374.1 NADH-qu